MFSHTTSYSSIRAVRRYSEARRKGLALELDECAVQLVRLRARAPPILRGLQVGAKSEAEELQLKYDTQGIVMASAINGSLSTWRASLPMDWKYTVQAAGPTLMSSPELVDGHSILYGEVTHRYPNLHPAIGWNTYRTYQLIASRVFVGPMRNRHLVSSPSQSVEKTAHKEYQDHKRRDS